MKVRDTSQGRMYAVSSEIGCTAINGAMAVDIPAGGQSVILALDKKLIIDGDDNAKFVEVRWGTNAAIGSRPAPSWISDVVDGLTSIVGEGKFDVNYIPAEHKLYLAFAYDTEAQIAEVENLLERVLPKDVVSEIDPFPSDFTRLEYLESTGKQYINTGIYPTSESYFDILFASTNNSQGIVNVAGARNGYPIDMFCIYLAASEFRLRYGNLQYYGIPRNYEQIHSVLLGRHSVVNGVPIDDFESAPAFTVNSPLWLFGCSQNGGVQADGLFTGKIYEAELYDSAETLGHFIPCLDDTGTPCMFDTVTRKPFYNKGTGDFLYPGKETESTTYSLRNRMYAQYTEHGIRRLYRVPEDYSSKEEYAEENGFKLLIETPQPEEGYWIPVWHDREDCIELEWIETEPPIEEELQIEEIENA